MQIKSYHYLCLIQMFLRKLYFVNLKHGQKYVKLSGLSIIILSLLLTSCSDNKIEEERFEIPTGDYPKLVDVPNRPTYLSKAQISSIQKNLESNRNAAIEAAKQEPET